MVGELIDRTPVYMSVVYVVWPMTEGMVHISAHGASRRRRRRRGVYKTLHSTIITVVSWESGELIPAITSANAKMMNSGCDRRRFNIL